MGRRSSLSSLWLQSKWIGKTNAFVRQCLGSAPCLTPCALTDGRVTQPLGFSTYQPAFVVPTEEGRHDNRCQNTALRGRRRWLGANRRRYHGSSFHSVADLCRHAPPDYP